MGNIKKILKLIIGNGIRLVKPVQFCLICFFSLNVQVFGLPLCHLDTKCKYTIQILYVNTLTKKLLCAIKYHIPSLIGSTVVHSGIKLYNFGRSKPVILFSQITKVCNREELSLQISIRMTSKIDILRSSVKENDHLYFVALIEQK